MRPGFAFPISYSVFIQEDKAMTDRMNNQRGADEARREDEWRNENRGLAKRDPSRYGMTRYEGWNSPFELMRRFSEDVDRLFNSLGFSSMSSVGTYSRPGETGRQLGQWSGMGMSTWTPSVDIMTRGDDLVVNVDLPGIKPEDVRVEADDDSLIIQGQTGKQDERKGQGYYYSERSYGSFFRRMPLPPGVNANQATAQFNNGVLEINLPGAVKQLRPE